MRSYRVDAPWGFCERIEGSVSAFVSPPFSAQNPTLGPTPHLFHEYRPDSISRPVQER